MKKTLLSALAVSMMTVSAYSQTSPPATHLNFDGVDDYIDLGNDLADELKYSSFFTVEGWIKTTHTTGIQSIVNNDSGGTVQQSRFRLNDDKLELLMGHGVNSVTSPAGVITADTWHHVAGVYNDTTLKLYVDGVEVATESILGTYSMLLSLQEYWIGNTNKENQAFSGSIDEVRVWKIARTAEQLAAGRFCQLGSSETESVNYAGLLAYFKFNQGEAGGTNTAVTSLPDVSGNGNNGSLVNFTLSGETSNWVAGSVVVTGSEVSPAPTVSTPVIYTVGDVANTLTAESGGTGLVWYTSATGNEPLTEAPTPDTSVAGETSYWVSSSNDFNCESERVEIVVTVEETMSVGEENMLNGLSIYPNPTNGVLTLSNTLDTEVFATVYDLNGRLLLSKTFGQNSNTLDLSNLNTGVYIVKLKTELGEVSKRVLKN